MVLFFFFFFFLLSTAQLDASNFVQCVWIAKEKVNSFFLFRTNPVVELTRHRLTSTALKPLSFWPMRPRFYTSSRDQIFCSFFQFFYPFFPLYFLAFAYCRGNTHIRAASTIVSNICEFSCLVFIWNLMCILPSNTAAMSFLWSCYFLLLCYWYCWCSFWCLCTGQVLETVCGGAYGRK